MSLVPTREEWITALDQAYRQAIMGPDSPSYIIYEGYIYIRDEVTDHVSVTPIEEEDCE